MKAVKHWETAVSCFLSVHGTSYKENKKKKIIIFSTILLRTYVTDFYDSFETHDTIVSGRRAESKQKCLSKRTSYVYNLRWVF